MADLTKISDADLKREYLARGFRAADMRTDIMAVTRAVMQSLNLPEAVQNPIAAVVYNQLTNKLGLTTPEEDEG